MSSSEDEISEEEISEDEISEDEISEDEIREDEIREDEFDSQLVMEYIMTELTPENFDFLRGIEGPEDESANSTGSAGINEGCSTASQETVENVTITKQNEGCSTASQETVENVTITKQSKERLDPDRERLLEMLQGDDDAPNITVEEKLRKLHEEKEDEAKNEGNNTNIVLTKPSTSNDMKIFNTDILHPQIDEFIDLTDEQKIVSVKVKKIDPVIVIEDDDPIINEKFFVKQEPETADKICLKKEKEDEPTVSLSHCVANQHGTEGCGNEAEEGEVIDDDRETKKNIVKIEPMSLIKSSLGNEVAPACHVEGFPIHTYAAVQKYTHLQISNIAENLEKLTKYVSKRKGKKKYHKKKSRKKSKSKRSRVNSSTSRSRSRSSSTSRSKFSSSRSWSHSSLDSRSRSRSQSSFKKKKFKKSHRSQLSRSRSPSRSPSRKSLLSSCKRSYRPLNKSRSRSRSLSKSPLRKRYKSNSFRSKSTSRSPNPPNFLVLKKGNRKRSPSASPPRRRRRFNNSPSSSDTSSSSSNYKRRRRIDLSRRSRFRSRSCTPNESCTTSPSTNVSSTSVSRKFVENLPSASGQTFVEKKTYQQEIRQGSKVMTRETIFTTSYKEELRSFKKSLEKKSSIYEDVEDELSKLELELTVFDEKGKDVTRKRPDGDLNHPFYIHPEDAELYQMKCRNGLQPLQALHEICVKCQWKLPNYLLLPTPKGFRFGMEIKGHRFVTEKTDKQKKLAKAAAAQTVLQWMRIVSISP